MERQIVVVNGRERKSFKRYGRDFIRNYVDVEVSLCDSFRKKCDLLGKSDSAVLRDLIYEFTHSFGWSGEKLKDPGSLYDKQSIKHVRDAVRQQIVKEFPWIFSEN